MSYSGRWHVEGHSENIVAAGVYYAHVPPGLTGGNLKFRPAEVPQPEYDIKTGNNALTGVGIAGVTQVSS